MSCRLQMSIISALVLCSVSATFGNDYPPQVGTPHPDFTLPSIEDGAAISLAQFRGRKLLLIQFASW
ncbi:MAG: peroxiredoxin family protein [Pirellulales bacterium]